MRSSSSRAISGSAHFSKADSSWEWPRYNSGALLSVVEAASGSTVSADRPSATIHSKAATSRASGGKLNESDHFLIAVRDNRLMAKRERHAATTDLHGDTRIVLGVLGGVWASAAVDGPGGGRPIDLGGRKQRAVLALLLARPNLAVPVDTLVEELWGAVAPATARHTIQVYVSELRRALPGVIDTSSAGYSCTVDATTLDSLGYEALVAAGMSLSTTDAATAVARLESAESLWTGEPFAGTDAPEPVTLEIHRLVELHLAALERMLELKLELLRHVEAVPELERLCLAHPFREGLRALHMLALYRSGRQADALRAYQTTRTTLAEELGVDPSPALQRLEEQILVQDPRLESGRPEMIADHNPYKGLLAFTEDDVDDFHGRSALVDELVLRLSHHPSLVALVGPSGSGKTSALRAGLTPRLSAERTVVYAVPTADPFEAVERALRRITQHPERRSGGRASLPTLIGEVGRSLVLIVDQLEELFTLVDEEHTRGEFLDQLASAAALEGVSVVVSLRADFYDRPLAFATFGRAVARALVTAMPLAPEEMEEAAVQPARRMGVAFEQGLLAAIFTDVAGQPNALPLFQYTLSELWERRRGDVLTLDAYRTMGGVRRSLAGQAEELFARLEPAEAEACRQLFLRLVSTSGESVARRRVPASELAELEIDLVAMQAAIEVFAGRRLLTLDRDPTSGAPVIDLAHEAIIPEWARLRSWITDAADDIRLLPMLDAAAADWSDSGEDSAHLAQGPRLERFDRLRTAGLVALTRTQARFVAASADALQAAEAADRQAAAYQRALKRQVTRLRWSAATALGVLAVAGVWWATQLTVPANPRAVVALAGPGIFSDDPRVRAAVEEARAVGMAAELRVLDFGNLEAEFEAILDESQPDFVFIDPFNVGWDWVEEAIRAHVATKFVSIDPRFNVPTGAQRVDLRWEEAGFLAGVVAGSTTDSGVVAMVGAGPWLDQYDQWRAGFMAGADAVRPGVTVLSAYTLAPPRGATMEFFREVPMFWPPPASRRSAPPSVPLRTSPPTRASTDGWWAPSSISIRSSTTQPGHTC